ncbi:MAG: T9SS type A sorting domain-containing protein, partial [Fibrobacteres bacterium]|nr:T9SS type A sorting domain-containing protein [Fibrobacterota bacterium]
SGLGRYFYDWRSYEWANKRFVEVGNDPSAKIIPGKAYWIRTAKSSFNVTADTAKLTAINKCFEIVLPPNEWVVFSNPYNFKVSWKSVLDSTENDSLVAGPFGYSEGSWIPPLSVRTLQPWAGYYVKNRGSVPLTLRIPSIEYKGALTKELVAVSTDSSSFMLEMEVSSVNGRSFRNYFGVQGGMTSSGYDNIFDAPAPPVAPDASAALAFIRSSDNGRQQKLMTDFSALNNGGEIWKVNLSGLTEGVVYTTAVNGLDKLPEGLNAVLVDRNRGIKIDLKKKSSVSVEGDKNINEKSLEVLVGSSEYIADNTRNLTDLPLDYAMTQNAPNPFNPATDIRFAVPETGKGKAMVNLSIYDAKGRLVTVLLSEKLDCGYHRVSWNGKTAKGTAVAAGVYMYKISIGDKFVKTMKMVLAK